MQAATVAVTRRVIRCDECPTPVAEVREQGIVIKSRHQQHATHVTIITWAALRLLMDEHDAKVAA